MMYKLCLQRLDYDMGVFLGILIFTHVYFVIRFIHFLNFFFNKSRSLKLILKMFFSFGWSFF